MANDHRYHHHDPQIQGRPAPVPAYRERDLYEFETLANAAYAIWKANLAAGGGDRGTCVLGAGLAIWVRKHRAHYAKSHMLVGPPGQADCQWCVGSAKDYLEERGVKGLHFEMGTMD